MRRTCFHHEDAKAQRIAKMRAQVNDTRNRISVEAAKSYQDVKRGESFVRRHDSPPVYGRGRGGPVHPRFRQDLQANAESSRLQNVIDLSKAVFDKDGDEYILREAWMGGGVGRELLRPRAGAERRARVELVTVPAL